MNVFDIIGPVMIGPSSSHTAGAVRLGRVAWKILGDKVVKADIELSGSFAQTYRGHGTDKALIAGVMGMDSDDERIRHSLQLAEEGGMEFAFHETEIPGAHPNTAILRVENREGRVLEVNASSLGGGRVRVNAIDGMEATFTGDYPTLIIRNEDRPGAVAEVTSILSRRQVNIATMQLYRDRRGGLAVMVLESDQPIWREAVDELRAAVGIVKVTYLNMEGEE